MQSPPDPVYGDKESLLCLYFPFIHKALAIESRLCDKQGTRLGIQPPVVATMKRDGDATLAMM